MTDQDHRALATVLHAAKSMVAISGYRSPLMDELYADWYRTTGPTKQTHSVKQPRQEVLWTNYNPAHIVATHQASDSTYAPDPTPNQTPLFELSDLHDE